MDFSDLISAVGDNKKALIELIDDFLASYQERSQVIRQTVSKKDAAKLEKMAHGFKSAVGIWGPTDAFEILSQLEMAGSRNDFSQTEEFMTCLTEALEKIRKALISLRNSLAEELSQDEKV